MKTNLTRKEYVREINGRVSFITSKEAEIEANGDVS